ARNRAWRWLAIGALTIGLAAPAEAARQQLATPVKKPAATRSAKPAKRSAAAKQKAAPEKKTAAKKARRGRIGKNRRTPALLGKPQRLPIEQPISPDIVDYLAAGDMTRAARSLFMEPATEKSLYLLRETQRIGEAAHMGRPSRPEARRFYLGLGVANHNVLLFLKRHGRPTARYARAARSAYAKARAAAPKAERAAVDILVAALDAATGKEKAAAKRFAKLPLAAFEKDLRATTYLATYFAAQKDIPHAVTAIAKAHEMSPGAIKSWLRVSDDFHAIQDAPEVKDLFSAWKIFE
ncbi:MAG: hypothetical protein HY543_00165, partial [Deltaproteobacteria bacterium]|nr:hypothetical protein [Deltaproteobacteria bacterium]